MSNAASHCNIRESRESARDCERKQGCQAARASNTDTSYRDKLQGRTNSEKNINLPHSSQQSSSDSNKRQ